MLGLGTTITAGMLSTPEYEKIRSAFNARVKSFGGEIENNKCMRTAIKDIL